MKYIKRFQEIGIDDVAHVGGKNASLGQMFQHLKEVGVRVPDGFAVTVEGYWDHLRLNGLNHSFTRILAKLSHTHDLATIRSVGKELRGLIEDAPLPKDLSQEIIKGYEALCLATGDKKLAVAVRSSATAEDLPDASFAGQQETFLHVFGQKQVLDAYRSCLASLFTDRAIMYRHEKQFDHKSIGLSVGIQQMVRSDKGAAGVMFTLDTESGFKDVVVISSAYGFGETVVKGEIVPDEFHVFKKNVFKNFDSLIKKECGSKKMQRVAVQRRGGTRLSPVLKENRVKFSLTDEEVRELAQLGCSIETYYSELMGYWTPMDIEWAKDGVDGKMYVVQARPETVHARQKKSHTYMIYSLKSGEPKTLLVKGQSVGQKIVSGKARVIRSLQEAAVIEDGEILVTAMTDPDWMPLMKKAGGIITENGGRTCHAAIVSRELGIPAIVGAAGALKKIENGQYITMDCSSGSDGLIYEGVLGIVTQEISLQDVPKVPVKLLVNVASPERAYAYSALPVEGVGLARLEFIITNAVQVHPMALAVPEKVKDKKTLEKVKELSAAYGSPQDFFVKKLAEGIATIAASFYPRPVLVRFSDFKSNEYKNLLGGADFEPSEENPMMGLRGASRYYHELYAPAFELECKALLHVRQKMGLHNVNAMVPFVRTIKEAEKIVALLKAHGLVSKRDGLELFMMCEIPSNVLLIDQFAQYFDGFSIGSNDLTQTTLSVDRDSGLLAHLFDERDEAVTKMLSLAIHGAHYAAKPIGICGQAPSDYPEIAQFLMDEGIDSISLNPDSVLPFLSTYGKFEEKVLEVKSQEIIPARII